MQPLQAREADTSGALENVRGIGFVAHDEHHGAHIRQVVTAIGECLR